MKGIFIVFLFFLISILCMYPYVKCDESSHSIESSRGDNNNHNNNNHNNGREKIHLGRNHHHNTHHTSTEKLSLPVASHMKHDPSSHSPKMKRCGGPKHALMTRPCPMNDTNCGHWDLQKRFWYPLTCRYDNITPEQARKCLGNRTLAFLGDSQIRDIGMGVALFLLGQELHDSPSYKFDYKGNLELNGTRIPDFSFWQHNVPGHNHNGYLFPQPEIAKQYGYTWQVQIWNLFRNEFIEGQAFQVLNNDMVSKFHLLRPIDFAFWQHGLHDYGWFNTPPYGEKFFGQMVRRWLNIRNKISIPSVWVSMNPECRRLITYTLSNMDLQALMVEEVNRYVNERTFKERLPYWDAGAVLRNPQRCNVSDDGVHVKMFVDIMRAKMLFNHLCDNDMNWRGTIHMFM